eukprot:12059685-Karenia_brevis.AAC.1
MLNKDPARADEAAAKIMEKWIVWMNAEAIVGKQEHPEWSKIHHLVEDAHFCREVWVREDMLHLRNE